MLLIYMMINALFFLCAKFLYKEFWNPISVYAAVWTGNVLLHESGLIEFYPFTKTTWYVMMAAETLYMLGCMIGRKSAKAIKYKSIHQDDKQLEAFLKNIILLISIIVTIVTYINIRNTTRAYGFNLLVNIARIYRDSIISLNTVETIPYISSLNFISLVLSGIYISKYRFRSFLIWPMVLAFAGQITNGSRGSLMSGIFLFLASVILFGVSIKVNKKKMYGIALGGIAGFLLITYFRGVAGINAMPYASDFLKGISGKSAVLYRVISYIANPVGVLNEYLKDPVYGYWGESTFRVFNNLFSSMGMDIEFREVIDIGIYNTPIQSNVGTYIGELIKDFKLPGALFVCFLLGLFFSYSHIRYKKNGSIFHGILVTSYFYVVCLSFFAWYVRLVIFWYVVLFGGFLGFVIDKIKLKRIRIKTNSIRKPI